MKPNEKPFSYRQVMKRVAAKGEPPFPSLSHDVGMYRVRPRAIVSKRMIATGETAKVLRCSKAHVSKAVSGRVPGCTPIPALSLDRRKLIRRETLLHWIESNEQELTPNDRLNPLPPRGCR